MRKLLSVMALFVLSILSVSLVSAAFSAGEVTIEEVRIDSVTVNLLTQAQLEATANVDNQPGFVVEEGEELEVKVLVASSTDAEKIQVEAEIRGFEYDDYEDISDRAHVFDLQGTASAEARKNVRLTLNLPRRMEDDRYLLRLTVEDKDSPAVVRYVVLQVEPARHGVDIRDVVFSPGNTVRAGRSLLTTVLLENFGDKVERDVKVIVQIPELGIRAAEFVDVVDVDSRVDSVNNRTGSNVDLEDVPEMFLPIPVTAAAGEYTVEVVVSYDDLRETVVQTHTIQVVENPLFGPTGESDGRVVLQVGPAAQQVAAGETAMYAIALSNEGRATKAYTLETVAGDWGTVSVSEPLVLLGAGKQKVVYVDITPNRGTSGTKVASVAIKSGDEIVETVTLTANVVAPQRATGGVSLRNGLEIALIVLVVLLVIIGLIVGFSRLRKDDDEQTYY